MVAFLEIPDRLRPKVAGSHGTGNRGKSNVEA